MSVGIVELLLNTSECNRLASSLVVSKLELKLKLEPEINDMSRLKDWETFREIVICMGLKYIHFHCFIKIKFHGLNSDKTFESTEQLKRSIILNFSELPSSNVKFKLWQ